jgi:hypothetical protein
MTTEAQIETASDEVLWEEIAYWDHRGPADKDPVSSKRLGTTEERSPRNNQI